MTCVLHMRPAGRETPSGKLTDPVMCKSVLYMENEEMKPKTQFEKMRDNRAKAKAKAPRIAAADTWEEIDFDLIMRSQNDSLRLNRIGINTPPSPYLSQMMNCL